MHFQAFADGALAAMCLLGVMLAFWVTSGAACAMLGISVRAAAAEAPLSNARRLDTACCSICCCCLSSGIAAELARTTTGRKAAGRCAVCARRDTRAVPLPSCREACILWLQCDGLREGCDRLLHHFCRDQ